MDFNQDNFNVLLKDVLNVIGFKGALKQPQIQALEAFYQGKDTMCLLPTGFGKSLIYQITPFLKGGCTLVVGPLNSILKDQVLSLTQKGVKACWLDMAASGYTYGNTSSDNSSEDDDSSDSIDEDDEEAGPVIHSVAMENLYSGDYRLIYTHPEALVTKEGRKMIEKLRERICCVAVDEAHIVQEWGTEFRPAFNQIKEITAQLRSPVMVFTATANKSTKQFLINKLELHDPVVVEVNPDRQNIFYSKTERLPSMDTYDDLDNILSKLSSEILNSNFPQTIVYTDLDTIAYCFKYLEHSLGTRQYHNLVTDPQNRVFAQYHHHYTTDAKQHIQNELCKDNTNLKLVFATIALGMGLDAKHVRRIIHFKPPTSIEKFLQETGRAGRDGLPAEAVLYWNNTDIRANRPGMKKPMSNFCKNTTSCMREFLLKHLDHKVEKMYLKCKCCSICACECKCVTCETSANSCEMDNP